MSKLYENKDQSWSILSNQLNFSKYIWLTIKFYLLQIIEPFIKPISLILVFFSQNIYSLLFQNRYINYRICLIIIVIGQYIYVNLNDNISMFSRNLFDFLSSILIVPIIFDELTKFRE